MGGFEMPKKQPPPEVLDAIRRGDEDALHAMAVAGGKKAGELSKRRAEEKALLEEDRKQRQEEEFRKRDEEANLHICPLDD